MPTFKIGDRVHLMDVDKEIVGVVMRVGTGEDAGTFRVAYRDRCGHERLEWRHESELTLCKAWWKQW